MSDVIATPEREYFDRKSLRAVTGSNAEFAKIAQDCVCFANSAGGALWIGIEDGQEHPPADQKIDPLLLERIRKRIGELTVNVQVLPELRRDPNGGEIIVLSIARSVGVASTADGRYFLRVGDSCQPIVGDDVLRLANERPAVPWERMTSLDVPRKAADTARVTRLVAALRASDRVKAPVKEKSDHELLVHYGLSVGSVLTNLGVMLVGTAADRARLGSAPVVQAIKYDERDAKISKLVWDDYALSPVDLVDVVWEGVPDFRESYELPDGMLRTAIPAFEKVVVRELLVNALVHRPYTQRGDIFINLHPDRLEIVNPGRLPLGVTPRNILHASRRRNDGLARIFHDLQLMEREGSGFVLMFERLLASGRAAPTVREGTDSVHVTVPRRVVHPGVIRLLAEIDEQYQLTQRERIALAMLAQTEGLSATELLQGLELDEPEALSSWIARLVEFGLIQQVGRTKGTRYFVWPGLVRAAGLDRRTTLARIEPHRLRALILEDLKRYPDSKRVDIHRRIGPEIHDKTIVRTLNALVSEKFVVSTGSKRWRTYRLATSNGHEP
jgi:ATP-dependent DNA helicase RecG